MHSWISKTNSFQSFLNDTHIFNVTNLKKQAQLHETLAQQKSIQDTHIRKINKVTKIEKKTTGNMNWRILQAWGERKSRYHTEANFTNTGVAGRMNCWMIQKNFNM